MKKTTLFCVISILVLITSCKKEKNNNLIPEAEPPTVTTPTINADKQNISQLEIVTLTSNNINFKQLTYTGIFASQTVTLTVLNNILGFQIPDVAAGTYPLQINIEGNSYNFEYNVQALPTISNPETYIQNEVNAIMHTPNQVSNLTSAMSNMFGAPDRAANNTIINNYFINFQNTFISSTAQEKMDLAKFVAANPTLFSPAEDLISFIDTLNGFKVTVGGSIEDRWNNLDTEVKNRVKVITTIGIASLAGFATGNPLFGALAGLYGVKKIYDLNIYLINELDKNLLQFGNTLLTDVQKITTPSTVFENGQEYTFGIKANYRNLNQQDIGSNSIIIKSLINSLNSFETVWNKVMSVVPTTLAGPSFHIKNVPTFHQKTFKVNSKYLGVVNISNPNVTVTTNTLSGLFKVKFNTTQTADQLFTFDIKYSNPNVNTSLSNHTGTVIPSLPPNKAGFGNQFTTLDNFSSALTGDQTGWLVIATGSGNGNTQCMIRTQGGFPSLPGTYTIVYPNSPLNSNEALVSLTTNNSGTGGFAYGGKLYVSQTNNKTVYIFKNISFENSSLNGSGNITLP